MMAASDADAEPPPNPDEAKESEMDTIVTSSDPSDEKVSCSFPIHDDKISYDQR